MPKNISFAMTTPQFIDGSKDVTRRTNWRDLKPGVILCGVEKGMGLKPGEKVKRLGLIEVVSVKFEPLQALLDDPEYGAIEMVREGFPTTPAHKFVEMLCKHYKCTPDKEFTRIEFKRACVKCKGMGTFYYPNTGIYWSEANLASVVGSGFTWGTCNRCWGTGNEKSPGKDLIQEHLDKKERI